MRQDELESFQTILSPSTAPHGAAEISKLSREYLAVRNRQMNSKALTAEMVLAQARGELIEKRLVEAQAAYLLISLRQRILAVPGNLCRKVVGIFDVAQAKKILRQAMLSLLNDLRNLPQKVTDPNWLRTLEKEEGK
jgi:hypothetical protein